MQQVEGTPRFSFIVPVYNRPQEVKELLESMVQQRTGDFEVVLVEDGSSVPCSPLLPYFKRLLPITYVQIPNGGPSRARNKGVEQSRGEWLIFLDSDIILPQNYVKDMTLSLEQDKTGVGLWGGPDAASDSFTLIQKAINYSMTSFLTTGGIRGKKHHVGRYCPRTYNMGCRRSLFDQLGGFDVKLRFGEDMDFCLRAYEEGAKVALFDKAWVYHKRRVDFRKFYKQVYNSGIARINLTLRHQGSLHWVHLLPSFCTLFLGLILIGCLWFPYLLFLPLLVAIAVFSDALHKTKHWKVSMLAIVATLIQITGYGSGLLVAFWRRIVWKKKEFTAFEETFYD